MRRRIVVMSLVLVFLAALTLTACGAGPAGTSDPRRQSRGGRRA